MSCALNDTNSLVVFFPESQQATSKFARTLGLKAISTLIT